MLIGEVYRSLGRFDRKYDSHHGGVRYEKGMSVDREERWSCGRCKGMWRGVTPVSMLRVNLTVTWEV